MFSLTGFVNIGLPDEKFSLKGIFTQELHLVANVVPAIALLWQMVSSP